MVTLQNNEKCETALSDDQSQSENHSKAIDNHSKKKKKKERKGKSLQNSEFHLFGKLTEGRLFCFELSVCELSKSEIHSFWG